MEVLRDDLGFAEAPPLERLLIEQVILCWVNLQMLELVHNDRLAANHTPEAGLYWDPRLSTAQRRFMRATESLARVRKLEERDAVAGHTHRGGKSGETS